MRPPLVLCLGNEILCDDAFGPSVAERLAKRADETAGVDVISASTAGFTLLELLSDREQVLVVDAIVTGHAHPGTLHQFDAGELAPSRTLTNSHQISLPTAIQLGRRLGLHMPTNITVLAVEALDVETLTEKMTPPVCEEVDRAVDQVLTWIAMVRRDAAVTR